MYGLRRSAVAVATMSLLLLVASPAWGAMWEWPVGSAVSLPFGASWRDGAGRSCAHGGVDIAGCEGDEVRAAVPGSVSFAGQVPSAAGGRVTAVTVRTADGLSVTYMPLAVAGVSAGNETGAGALLGTLAAAGDGSSAETHLHLSVKRGELALDPATFLGGAPTAPPAVPAVAPAADPGEGPGSAQPVAVQPPPVPAPAESTLAASAEAAPAASTALVPESAPTRAAPPAPSRRPSLARTGRTEHVATAQRMAFSLPGLLRPLSSAAARLLVAVAAALAMWARICTTGLASRVRAEPSRAGNTSS